MTSRRNFLTLAGAGSLAAFAGLPAFTASAAQPLRPAAAPLAAEDSSLLLRYPAPAAPDRMIQQGLPVGNGRLGGLVGGDPGKELLHVTDGTLWTGGLNDVLDDDGQFPYERVGFGSFTQLAQLTVELPEHSLDAVTDYRRTLDLANGLVTASYVRDGVTYRREVYASHPDDAVIVHLSQSGGGSYTGRIDLAGTHGESTSADASDTTASFGASFDNGLRYGAAVTAVGPDGTVSLSGQGLAFSDCTELTVALSGGTNYAPDPANGYRDPATEPRTLAREKVRAAAGHAPAVLRNTHVADYQGLFGTLSLSLGASSEQQRGLDTWSRLQTRAAEDAAPDPELEASYLQFGRYLMICGSRDSVPLNLQGLWLDGNDPDWMGDYHTDINVQMNYWMADRAGLSDCFDALTDYCLAQLPSWSDVTGRLFNDPRNRFRNSSGRIAGWAVAFSTNIYGGSGWWWHPAANAWLCNTLFEHYEYTQDRQLLARIHPLLKGACEFWEARLITTDVTDPATGESRTVLVDDKDWSPEHGPQDGLGNTYSQELVWALFGNYQAACAELGTDADHSAVIGGLRERLYLPVVSPTTGWLEEWMSPDNLGEETHRHLSPLIGLFPGDRIGLDVSSGELLSGVRALLTARGMDSFGWSNAWRALCWARLKEAETAYRLIATNLRPSVDGSNGTAENFFDIYQAEPGRGIFQIDANFGTPSAMVEMLVQSRPGHIELLPALPAAWAESGSVTGIGARGGFVVDLSWHDGKVDDLTLRSVGGGSVTVTAGSVSRAVTVQRGGSVTLRNFADH
ncbi:glycosyl hydrolase family 95 catalytic domain-containing protein [Streptomyces sp. NPDC088725]|uniref:glycosyl hydrolase family 95 catalytic domain-containing protein n=1 Tax=Streptomyces sp. NPDC088725 TaxID=3365873 RepID=UPI0038289F06